MKRYAIYGPPGTGKTTHLVGTITDFVKTYKPSEITFLSHTRAAAKEATERLVDTHGVKASTIHSIAYHIAGVSRQQVVDWKKLQEFAAKMGTPINGGNMDTEEGIGIGDELLAMFQLSVNRMVSTEQIYHESDRPTSQAMFQAFCEAYVDWKESNGFIDFNDMLSIALKEHAIPKSKVYIIDEAQDLSPLQWALINKIAKDSEHVIIAGDDDQSLHLWAGADPDGMPRFEAEGDTERVILDKSWRVPSKIHTLSQDLIHRIKNRIDKKYTPKDEPGEINQISDLRFCDFDSHDDTMILYRNHVIRKEIERDLISAGIPFIADSGMPTLFQNKWARAIRSYYKLKEGGTINDLELKNMVNCAFNARTKQVIQDRDFKRLLTKKWEVLFNTPSHFISYYRNVDLTQTPKIRISSIHGSKGREADRVILHTGMTQRTIESMTKDPDSEVRVFYVGVTRARKQLDIVEGDRGFSIY